MFARYLTLFVALLLNCAFFTAVAGAATDCKRPDADNGRLLTAIERRPAAIKPVISPLGLLLLREAYSLAEPDKKAAIEAKLKGRALNYRQLFDFATSIHDDIVSAERAASAAAWAKNDEARRVELRTLLAEREQKIVELQTAVISSVSDQELETRKNALYGREHRLVELHKAGTAEPLARMTDLSSAAVELRRLIEDTCVLVMNDRFIFGF